MTRKVNRCAREQFAPQVDRCEVCAGKGCFAGKGSPEQLGRLEEVPGAGALVFWHTHSSGTEADVEVSAKRMELQPILLFKFKIVTLLK